MAEVPPGPRRADMAAALMRAFTERTGLAGNVIETSSCGASSSGENLHPTTSDPNRRYLWTDAFAACNFVALATLRGDRNGLWAERVQEIIHGVHTVLGAHRIAGDPRGRTGPISGLPAAEASIHPTAGGLRIGKPLPEKFARDGGVVDGWDRDGQYFHYAVKWLHALCRVASFVDRPPPQSADVSDGRDAGSAELHAPTLRRWARELVTGIHPHFTYTPGSGHAKRMYWKMAVDLRDGPAVHSMGHHDPLDGWISYLEAAAGPAGDANNDATLGAAIDDLEAIVRSREPADWITDDTLGLGGLLCDCFRLGSLSLATDSQRGALVSSHSAAIDEQFAGVLRAALASLQELRNPPRRDGSAARRLAFREFGLSIGLQAIQRLRGMLSHPSRSSLLRFVDHILAFDGLVDDIHAFWMREENRTHPTWTEHEDINDVMFATSLLPDGFLRAAV
jgi:hypothetical protein